jgi:hypothetical protein
MQLVPLHPGEMAGANAYTTGGGTGWVDEDDDDEEELH